jgi:hypothetical protein
MPKPKVVIQDDLTNMSLEKLLEQLQIEEETLKQSKIARNFVQQERVTITLTFSK